jgi:hypothetical protein
MEGDPDDAQSMVDDSEAPPLDPMDIGSPATSTASGGGGAHYLVIVLCSYSYG